MRVNGAATRVLLVDDHALVRAGVRVLLSEIPGVDVVGEAGDGREAIALAEAQHPDIVFMDISLPVLNGIEATPRLIKSSPDVRVLILSMHAGEEYIVQALRAGASGFLLKDAAVQEFALAIETVRRGGTYLSHAIPRTDATEYPWKAEDAPPPLTKLTSRQREVLQLIAEGKSTKEIARLLDLSAKTVETHRTKLMERLEIHDVAGLVRLAIRCGLVTAER